MGSLNPLPTSLPNLGGKLGVDTSGSPRRLCKSTRIPLVFRIEPRPTEQLSVRVLPEVIVQIDRMALRFKVTRAAVARALIDSGLEQLRYCQQAEES